MTWGDGFCNDVYGGGGMEFRMFDVTLWHIFFLFSVGLKTKQQWFSVMLCYGLLVWRLGLGSILLKAILNFKKGLNDKMLIKYLRTILGSIFFLMLGLKWQELFES